MRYKCNEVDPPVYHREKSVGKNPIGAWSVIFACRSGLLCLTTRVLPTAMIRRQTRELRHEYSAERGR
jgi:hypothetical protein